MLSAMGFILVIAMVALIIRGKVALPPILVLLPTAAVFILGFASGQGPVEILGTLKGYMNTGYNSVLSTCALFTFAVVYFNILSDAGMFDVIIPGFAPRLSENHIEYQCSPELGGSNEEVYGDLLGYSAEELAELKAKKVI